MASRRIRPLVAVAVAALSLPSCSKLGGTSINGVRITEDTRWTDVTHDEDDKRAREEIRTSSEELLLASRFDELEAMAAAHRASRRTFKNGEWALNAFYSGLTNYMVNRHGRDENWERRLERIRAWVSARPTSVTARVALAECLVGFAFNGRGYRDTRDTSPEQKAIFLERVQEAEAVLDEAARLGGACPQLPAARMRLHGPRWTQARFLEVFDDAVRSSPDFWMYHFRTAIVLMPRWYGSDAALQQFCRDVADRVGGRQGDLLYARIVWFLDYNLGLGYLKRLDASIDWARVKRGIESLS